MLRIDEFESVFKRATKARFHYGPVDLTDLLLLSDRPADETKALADRVAPFFKTIEGLNIDVPPAEEFDSIEKALALVEAKKPQVICTYRGLFKSSWNTPYSLGGFLDTLTQATDCAVLAIPHPKDDKAAPHALKQTKTVVVVTDHLTGDDRLVNVGVELTENEGRVILSHVEAQSVFESYMKVIEKVPDLDTEQAREGILEQLLKEPRDYIEDVKRVLAEQSTHIEVEALVELAHRVPRYMQLVQEREVDLLVLNTKDTSQVAMHPLAYPIAIEFRQIPILML